MEFNHRFSVVIWPDPENWEAVNQVRAKFDAHYKLVGPHITIAFPDKVDRPVEQIVTGIAAACRQVKPFTAVFDRWLSASELWHDCPDSTRFLMNRYPNAVNFIVLVAGQGSTEMFALRHLFSASIPQPELLANYPIYMTLGQTLSDEAFLAAKAELANYRPNIRIPVISLDLLAEQADGTWPRVESFPLGK